MKIASCRSPCLAALAARSTRSTRPPDAAARSRRSTAWTRRARRSPRKDWNVALRELKVAVRESPQDADVHNLLGYTYRKRASPTWRRPSSTTTWRSSSTRATRARTSTSARPTCMDRQAGRGGEAPGGAGADLRRPQLRGVPGPGEVDQPSTRRSELARRTARRQRRVRLRPAAVPCSRAVLHALAARRSARRCAGSTRRARYSSSSSVWLMALAGVSSGRSSARASPQNDWW